MSSASSSAQSAPDAWSTGRLRMFATFNPSRTEARAMLARDDVATFLPMEAVSTRGDIHASDQRPATELADGFTYFRRNDVLIAKITPCFENGKGAVLDALPTEIGFGSTEFIVARANLDVDPRFLYLLTTTPTFRQQGADAMTGSAGQQRVPLDFIKNFVVAIPTLQQQEVIVGFIRRVDHGFTRLIRNKGRLIALLNEEKQAIIQQAVTRGLDPDVPLKPSGVEWLGDIPAHWEIGPLRRFCNSWCDGPFGSGLTSAHYSDQGIRVIRLQNIGFAEFKDTDAAFIPVDHYASLGDHDVEPGDLLVAGLGDSRNHPGRAAVAPLSLGPTMVKADCFRFRPLPEALDSQFMALQLSATSSLAGHILSTGATRSRINLRAMADRRIAVPPLNEQELIAAMLSNKLEANRLLVDCQLREIDLIREYRTRLISDVVTGQLDVRDVQFDDDFAVENLDMGGVELLDDEDVSLKDSDEIMDEEAGVA